MSSNKVFLVEMMPTIPNLGSSITMPRSGLMTMAAILSERTDYDCFLLFEPYCGAISPDRLAKADPRFLLLNGLTTTAAENEILVRKRNPGQSDATLCAVSVRSGYRW